MPSVLLRVLAMADGDPAYIGICETGTTQHIHVSMPVTMFVLLDSSLTQSYKFTLYICSRLYKK